MGETRLIEALYWELRKRGGQRAQLDATFETAAVASAFATTVDDVQAAPAGGTFFPPGTRKPLFVLERERADSSQISSTPQVQALLGRPPRWEVVGDSRLDFEYAARELTPMSAVRAGRRVWLRPGPERRLSLDALLINADDRTPIVAEIKVGGDENAELGLVQALVAAAQLSSPSQLRRLHREFYDFFDQATPPQTLDVYVITARAPDCGVRPALAKRAHERGRELMQSGALSRWVRRLAFLEMSLVNERPAFRAVV